MFPNEISLLVFKSLYESIFYDTCKNISENVDTKKRIDNLRLISKFFKQEFETYFLARLKEKEIILETNQDILYYKLHSKINDWSSTSSLIKTYVPSDSYRLLEKLD
ncbi:1205_t:CDS:2, partial [Cetraspora pellucida]